VWLDLERDLNGERKSALDVGPLLVVAFALPLLVFRFQWLWWLGGSDSNAFSETAPFVALHMVRHVQAGKVASPAEIRVSAKDVGADIRRALCIGEHVVKKLVWVLPRLVVLFDGCLYVFFALSLLLIPRIYIVWYVGRVVVKDDNLVDAKDCGCACNAAREQRLMIGFDDTDSLVVVI
jgi:hypothetical protein